MKFVVNRESYGNIVDVRLHWESKEKIKKICSYGLFVAAGVVVVAHRYVNNTTVDETLHEN